MAYGPETGQGYSHGRGGYPDLVWAPASGGCERRATEAAGIPRMDPAPRGMGGMGKDEIKYDFTYLSLGAGVQSTHAALRAGGQGLSSSEWLPGQQEFLRLDSLRVSRRLQVTRPSRTRFRCGFAIRP